MKKLFVISAAVLLTTISLTQSLKKMSAQAMTKDSNNAFIAGEQTLGSKLIDPPVQDWFPIAPSLPEPTGEVIRVSNVTQLYQAVDVVKPGGTISIADGHYQMPRSLVIRADDVTMRSENDDRTKVILDFENSRHGEGVVINSNTGFTLASLTVQNVTQNGIKINSNLGVDRVTIYNVISHNVWQRHIKGPHVPDNDDGTPSWVEDCRVQYCLFYNDRAKRLDDEPYEEENPDIFNGNYIAGIDVMESKDWIISDNVFINIRGRTGEGRGAIFMWYNSFNCIIERNILIDNDSGILIGSSHGRSEDRRHCNEFIVRNNFVTRKDAEEGIIAAHTRDCQILHNTVHNSGNGRLIRIVHANDGLLVTGNIFSGWSWGVRIDEFDQTGPIVFSNNLHKSITEAFVNPENGDLHLKATALDVIDKGSVIDGVAEDIDRQLRDYLPDLGADEFTSIVSSIIRINRSSELTCSVFPNPTTDFLTLEVENYNNTYMSYQFFDFNGKLLMSRKIKNNKTIIDMGNFMPATYFLKIFDNKKEINTFKIIKN